MAISRKVILFIRCVVLMILNNNLETGASSMDVKRPFVEFTSKLDDVEVLDDFGKASVSITWNYSARHAKYDDNFSGFFVSFGKVDENAINCRGKRYTSYEPSVVKAYHHKTLKITKTDKHNKLRTTKDLKAKLTFSNLKFSDSGKYFCRLTLRTLTPFWAMSKVSEVNLRVVDIQINKALSSSVVQAKINQEIELCCVVKIVNGVKPVFEWKRAADNSTVLEGAKQVDKNHSSISRLVIQFPPNDFVNYTCTARTARTTVTHTVLVFRPPRDRYEPNAEGRSERHNSGGHTLEGHNSGGHTLEGQNSDGHTSEGHNNGGHTHATTGRPEFYLWLLVVLLSCNRVFS